MCKIPFLSLDLRQYKQHIIIISTAEKINTIPTQHATMTIVNRGTPSSGALSSSSSPFFPGLLGLLTGVAGLLGKTDGVGLTIIYAQGRVDDNIHKAGFYACGTFSWSFTGTGLPTVINI